MIKITKIYLLNNSNLICVNNCSIDILRSNLEHFRNSIKLNNINNPTHVVFEYKTF